MPRRKHVLLCIGGPNVEHAISIRSSRSVVKHFPWHAYDLNIVGIDHQGDWFLLKQTTVIHEITVIDYQSYQPYLEPVVIASQGRQPFLLQLNNHQKVDFDIVLPMGHGTFLEDGCLQGLLSLYQIPFVGNSLLSSAITMHKSYTHKLLAQHDLPVIPHVLVQGVFDSNQQIASRLSYPLPWIVKPVNSGSSVGMSVVTCADALNTAIETALRYSHAAMIEPLIKGRELEVAVMSVDGKLKVSQSFGEIKLNKQAYLFYDYQAKYEDASAASLIIPADLPEATLQQGRLLAQKAFEALGCHGLARVDFFLVDNTHWLINEINTLPGFTDISLFPKLWMHEGFSFSDIIAQLINDALIHHASPKPYQMIDQKNSAV